VDGARLELALHGCRPWVIPLYEPPSWGEMRESNSRNWSHNPAPQPFGQSRHRIWSCRLDSHQHRPAYKAGAFVCRPQQQTSWSWHAASNCGRALTVRLLFLLSYTRGAGAAIRTPITDLRGPRSSHSATPAQNLSRQSGGCGENCTPDDLLCRQTPCCLGYTASNIGAEGGTRTRALDVGTVASSPLDDFRMERAARVELASSGWRPEAPAAIPCSLLAGDEGLEPS
jgi:hypothetical protein